MNTNLVCLSVLLSVLAHTTLAAPLGTAFTYQGRLTEGANPANGTYDLRFAIYDSPGGASPIGPALTHTADVTNGLFTTTLDFGAVFDGSARWLGIAVRPRGSSGDFVVLEPRQPVTPTPYALHAANAAHLRSIDTGPVDITVNGQRALRLEFTGPDAANLIGGYRNNSAAPGTEGVFIGGGGLNDGSDGDYPNRVTASYSAIAGGYGNRVDDESAFIGGGVNNQVAFGAWSSVIGGGHLNRIGAGAWESFLGGGRYNGIEQDSFYSVVAGGYQNTVRSNSPNATIGGGYWNFLGPSAASSTIGGGTYNEIGGADSTIAGGHNNAIEEGHTATIAGGRNNWIKSNGGAIGGGESHFIGEEGGWSFIGGGQSNAVNAFAGTLSGGSGNVLSAHGGSIGGGLQNTNRGSAATVSGGHANWAIGSGAAIGGGEFNGTEGWWSVIGGGRGNHIEGEAETSTIAGGSANTIQSGALHSTIGGGSANTIRASADDATIPGGSDNIAGASFALAAGRGAQALHLGSFVWADSRDDCSLASTTNDQFTARASGGVRFFSDACATTGVELAAGGNAWSVLSDRNAKENVAPLDGRDVLAKLSALPVTTWNLKTQGAQTRHVGPMAQDFHAAFGVGEDERHISTSDADGVALAAIQGLHEIVREKDAEIQTLKQRLEVLERLLGGTAAK